MKTSDGRVSFNLVVFLEVEHYYEICFCYFEEIGMKEIDSLSLIKKSDFRFSEEMKKKMKKKEILTTSLKRREEPKLTFPIKTHLCVKKNQRLLKFQSANF